MQMCDKHWELICQAIKDNGIWHLVANDAAEAVERIAAKNPDPLVAATMMIYGEAMKCGGPYLVMPRPDGGEYCPVCEAMVHATGPDDKGKVWTSEMIEVEWTVEAVNAVARGIKAEEAGNGDTGGETIVH